MPYYKYYHYDPSLAAAILFTILFASTTLWHLILLVKHRTLYFIPVIIGGVCTFTSPFASLVDRQPPKVSLTHPLQSRSSATQPARYQMAKHRT